VVHYVSSSELQNTLFEEVCRVLKSGGVFAGMDSGRSFGMRLLHLGDTCVPVASASFTPRLEAPGFRNVSVESDRFAFRFHAVAA